MGLCKCGLSDEYPECNGTHSYIKNESLRQAILNAYKQWELENQTKV